MTIQNTSSTEVTDNKVLTECSFYSGAGREELVEQIRQAVENCVPFIAVTGDEGTGKTVVVQAVIKQVPQHYVVAAMPTGVQSFDEILQVIAKELGIVLPEQKGKKILGPVIETIRKHLEDGGLKLLVVFDSAELLYLATLERARKNFDRINSESTLVTLLLAGRPALTEHLRQLSMCNFESEEENHFSLSSLSAEETVEYLNYCLQQEGHGGGQTTFSYEAGGKIYEVAGGNFRMTRVIADQILNEFSGEKPAKIEADDVEFKELEKQVETSESTVSWLNKKTAIIAILLALIAIVLFLFMPAADEATRSDVIALSESQDNPVAEAAAVSDDVKENRETEAVEQSAEEKIDPLEEARAELAAIEESVKAEKEAERLKAETDKQAENEKEVQQPESEAETAAEVEVETQIEEKQEIVSSDAPAEVPEIQEEPSKKTALEQVEEVVTEEEAVPEPPVETLQPEPESSAEEVIVKQEEESPVEQPAQITELPAGDPDKPKSATQIEPVRVSGESNDTIQDKFDERSVAGLNWLYGGAEDKFTVQLMVLTSDNAEGNLRKMLVEEGYRDIADELYILKKSDAETPLLVFYGEYSTMSEARNARNTLPQFLRKHHPYPISIKGAVEKAK